MTASIASYAQLDGLVMRDVLGDGGWILVEDVKGWGSPSSSLSPQRRPSAHGAWSGAAYLGPRSLVLSGVLGVEDPEQLSHLEDRLNDAVALDPVKLTVVEDGRARWCMVRRVDEVLTQRINRRSTRWSAQVLADDPRKYGDPQSGSTELPSTVGGLTAPLTAPVSSGAVTASGFVSIRNEGNIESPVTIRFTAGPSGLLGPSVTHVQSGRTWAAAGAQLVAGEFWELRQPSLQVLAMGQSSRAGYVSSRGRFELRPGPNDFVFGADMYVPDAQMTVTASSAWK